MRRKNKMSFPGVTAAMLTMTLALLFLTIPAHADINSGLVGYWTFDENSGTYAQDSTGHGNTGTLINNPVWTANSKVGAGALQFNGGGYVSLANPDSYPSSTPWTISFWANLTTPPANQYFAVSWGNVSILYNGSWRFVGGPATGSVLANTWYFITATFDGTNFRIYRDKNLVSGPTPISPTAVAGTTAYIGARTGVPNLMMYGFLDDVRIYNRALSDADVLELYNFRSNPDVTPPSMPANLRASHIEPKQVTIFWDASTDNEGFIKGYKIYRDNVELATLQTTNYTDTNLVASTNYSYKVVAFDSALPQSNVSNAATLSVRTADADLTPPVISNIHAAPFATLSTITWITNENADSKVEYGTTASYGLQATSGGSSKEHSVMLTNLMPETSYHFRIKSTDASPDKNSAVSIDQTFTTPKFIGPTANNITEAGEACDGSDLNGLTCSSFAAGFTGGALKCKTDRSGYDVSACVAGGQTLKAASCNAVDVQARVDQAQDGDTIEVPAGTCTWTTPVVNGQYSYLTKTYTSKSIVLKGAGIDQTTIIENLQAPGSALGFNIQSGKPIRVTGFTFDGAKTQDNYASITLGGPPGGSAFRVDHCKFTHVTERGILVNSVYGLIDHNIFLRIPIGHSVTEISVVGDHGSENDSWTRPQDQGTANAVYIEKNTFVHNINANGPFDMYDGARYVFRDNDMYGNNLGHHGFDSGIRGMVNFEVYNNRLMNGLPKESPYWSMYAHVAKVDFTTADPANGASKLATLISKGILEENTDDPTRVHLKTLGVAMPSELQTPMYAYLRIWGILNGAFVHGVAFEFRSGSGLLFNNTVKKTDNSSGDFGVYDLFVILKNYRSGDGYVANQGGTIPWNGSPWNGVCDGTAPMRIAISSSGNGYQVGDILTITQTGGSGATVRVSNVDGSGSVKGVELLTIGNGYVARDDIPTSGGHGGGAKISIGMDGNTAGGHGYPCEDQIGRTSNQALSPVYAWNNDFQGKVGGNLTRGGYATFMCPRGTTFISKVDPPPEGIPYSWVCRDNATGKDLTLYDWFTFHIVEGRDYINGTPKPGYVPYVEVHPLAQLDFPDVVGGNGDVSKDGKVTMYDAALALRYSITGAGLTQAQITSANMDGNKDPSGREIIDNADIIAISRKALGL